MTSTILTQIDLNWPKIDNDKLWDIKNIWFIITVTPNFLGDFYEAKIITIPEDFENFTLLQKLITHSSPLRMFGFSAISTYKWYLPSICGTNALIWGYFWIVRKGSFRGRWGGMMIDVEFWGCDLKILQFWLLNSKR